jgi:hypothetical protein
VIGLASRLVINQPDAVSNIAVPTFETRLAVRITVKARWMNGPNARERVLSAPRRWSDLRSSRSPGGAPERPRKRLVNQLRNTFCPTLPR